MPTRHGIEVLVTKTDLDPLVEYGSQSIGHSAALSKIVSTRIEAKDTLQFYIRVRPQYPFPLTEADLRSESDFSVKTPFFSLRDDYMLRHPRRFNENTPIEEQEREDSGEEDQESIAPGLTLGAPPRTTPRSQLTNSPVSHRNSPVKGLPANTASRPNTRSSSSFLKLSPTHAPRGAPDPPKIQCHPPFDLTASIYIDGHEKPECRQVIYLNPNHPKFYPGGFVFKGRWVAPPPQTFTTQGMNSSSIPTTSNIRRKNNAHISIRNWVFQSIPMSVDTLTDRFMTICSTTDSSTPPSAPQSEAERMLNDLTSTLSSNTDMLSAEHRPKPGQIEVRIRRIVAGVANSSTPFKAYHYAGANESIDPFTTSTGASNNEDPTHTTSLRPQVNSITGEEEKIKLNTVPWRAYKKGEDVYVKFIFNYSGREKLVRLGLCDAMGRPSFTGRIFVPKADTGSPISRKRGVGDAEEERYSDRDDDSSDEDVKAEHVGTEWASFRRGGTAARVPEGPRTSQAGLGMELRSAKRRLGGKEETVEQRQQQAVLYSGAYAKRNGRLQHSKESDNGSDSYYDNIKVKKEKNSDDEEDF